MCLSKMCLLLLLGGVSSVSQLGLVSCIVLFMSYFLIDLSGCSIHY